MTSGANPAHHSACVGRLDKLTGRMSVPFLDTLPEEMHGLEQDTVEHDCLAKTLTFYRDELPRFYVNKCDVPHAAMG